MIESTEKPRTIEYWQERIGQLEACNAENTRAIHYAKRRIEVLKALQRAAEPTCTGWLVRVFLTYMAAFLVCFGVVASVSGCCMMNGLGKDIQAVTENHTRIVEQNLNGGQK